MIRARLRLNFNNSKGWQTKRQIIVFESDDWGSIRMPSKESYNRMLEAGIRVDQCPYNRYDSLETEDDLVALFEVLLKYRDFHGNPPIFTANHVTCNPDFNKIEDSDYQEYYYEYFTKSQERSLSCRKSFVRLKQGIVDKIIFPQFHGREHLNISRWMRALRQNLPETMLAFDNGLFGLSTTITKENRRSYLAAFDFDSKDELASQRQVLADGLNIFEKIFGFRSETFIASNYIWHTDLEKTLFQNGIRYLQGTFVQKEPQGHGIPFKNIRHRLGQRNSLGQVYLTRNAYFEPSLAAHGDPVANCLSEVKNAFYWHKPAIISTHRVNYMGGLIEKNREENLKHLSLLLGEIQRRWRDVEFMSSDNLGALMISKSDR